MNQADSLAVFSRQAGEFIDRSLTEGLTCPAYGAILPPKLYDQAMAWQRHCFDNGFAGVHWPSEYGGRGLSTGHYVAWSVACAERNVAPYANFQGFVLAGAAILKFGTEEQKQRFLQPTLAADITWCQLFSEPNSGSDLASLSTRAEPDGDRWRVTGQKVWSSTAQFAQWAILLARTDPDAPNHGGISFFLFDMTGPGVEIRPLKQMTGESEFCEVFLDGADVGPEGLLGPLNGGWKVATSVLADERAGVASTRAGLERQMRALRTEADGAVNEAAAMELQARADAIGSLFSRVGGNPMLGPLSKLGLTELTARMTTFSLNSRGAGGMLISEATEPFLYAPGMRLAGGTSEIQRNLVGERLLGLPREPRPTSAPPARSSQPPEPA